MLHFNYIIYLYIHKHIHYIAKLLYVAVDYICSNLLHVKSIAINMYVLCMKSSILKVSQK